MKFFSSCLCDNIACQPSERYENSQGLPWVLAYPIGGLFQPLRSWGHRRWWWWWRNLKVAEAGYVDLWKCRKARAIARDVDPETVSHLVKTG